MSFNTFGKLFRFTTWGESHGPAIGCVVDGCPPNITISEKVIGRWVANTLQMRVTDINDTILSSLWRLQIPYK